MREYLELIQGTTIETVDMTKLYKVTRLFRIRNLLQTASRFFVPYSSVHLLRKSQCTFLSTSEIEVLYDSFFAFPVLHHPHLLLARVLHFVPMPVRLPLAIGLDVELRQTAIPSANEIKCVSCQHRDMCYDCNIF